MQLFVLHKKCQQKANLATQPSQAGMDPRLFIWLVLFRYTFHQNCGGLAAFTSESQGANSENSWRASEKVVFLTNN